MKRTATQLEFQVGRALPSAPSGPRIDTRTPAIHQRKPKFQSPYCRYCYHQHKHCTCNRPNP